MELHQIDALLENEGEMLEFWRSLRLRPGFELSLKHLGALSAKSLKTVISLLRDLEENSTGFSLECPSFMPGYQLMRTYLEETFTSDDMKAFDIDTRRAGLGKELAGLVYRSSIGRYVIIVNKGLGELDQDALAHQEIRRVLEERPPQQLRLIGTEAVNHLEPEVDEFVEAIFSIRF